MRVHADPSVITPPPGGPKRAPGSEQHLLAPQQHASSITVHVEPSPSAPRQKLHGSSQWGANGGTPDTRLADNDERKSDSGVGHAVAVNGGSSARVVPAGGIATTNPPRRNGNSRLRASADIGSDRSLGSDSHPRPPLSESKAAPHVQIPTVAASPRGCHAGSVTSRSTAGTRRRRKRHSGSTAAPSMSVRVTEMALEPLSVARMSCDMAPLDYLPSLRVLLRAVGSDSHDVEAVYVGDSTVRRCDVCCHALDTSWREMWCSGSNVITTTVGDELTVRHCVLGAGCCCYTGQLPFAPPATVLRTRLPRRFR